MSENYDYKKFESDLQNEFDIMHLIYHRNRNQHRLSVWWKYLNILHRYTRKILLQLQVYHSNKNQKRRVDTVSSIENIVKYLFNKKIFRKAYFEFNGIIALGQFLSLGLALIATLSKIHEIIAEFWKLCGSSADVKVNGNTSCNDITDQDLGEIIENPDSFIPRTKAEKASSNDIVENSKLTTNKRGPGWDHHEEHNKSTNDKSGKKKKKRKKNDIDAIFGF